ncbi:hypothetical protein Ahy_A02g005442 isoform B [Arachis hypogaea]|uniref:Uncharacterized protein n=1 Tax=Arachis hypogaea TaxID=3818 RepID=A0A445E731_ARAHY|nr:hypothetical protein Ahy_A02g005442 isoform B [Arachis hypogaea]
MAAMRLLFNFLIVPFFLSTFVYAYSSNDVKHWCSQTPNPQPCEYFLTNNPNHQTKPINQKTDFLKISLQLAQERALIGHANTLSLGTKCRNQLERVAWNDCVDLYQQTIQKLNKTLDPNTKCSQVDAQTWLSTALTNLETCKAGFYELGVQDYVLPLMSNNVTKLLSNTLALNNNGESHQQPSYKDGFPTWVKPGDRKLLQASSPASQANVVVAKDGSGKYTTVMAAINAAPKSNSGRYVIYVKGGIYNEQVEIKANNIMLVGDGIGKTIITGSQSVGGGTTTFRSATVAVTGDGFIGQGMTFRNTAGAGNHQAVVLRSGSDLSVFYQCSFEGYQDTLYVYSDRQFYKQCDIYGTVDFIFGNAAVVFQNCNLYARNPPNKINTITAQGRTDPNQNTGISIHNCVVTAASDLKAVQSSVKTYLGRPWQQYSRTVFMKSSLDSLIDPAGWLEWNGNFALTTLYYGEYMNTGLGSSTANRVKWGGYHVITNAAEASKFSVANFIAGNSWLPSTRVPFTAEMGLLFSNFLIVLFFLSTFAYGYSSNDVKHWCSQTPNPQPCEYFLSNNPNHFHKPIKHKGDFLKLLLQLAQERALIGHANTLSLHSKCHNQLERVAWNDCVKLYQLTIHKLNKILDPNTKCSKVDAQTWLSTALTNLETCKAGFYELGVQDSLLPLMSHNNLTKLLSNLLALNNKGESHQEPSYKDGFPTWVKQGDKKLLQASSPASQANVVVAKDGSGKYTTVMAAINAAPNYNSGRYVIYVKAGIYNEQVEIEANNIMLIGDGIGKTIITGSQSVGGGSTTFNSSTVGIMGEGCIAQGITFRNTAGAANQQAVALRSGSDLSVFYRCSFEGYQDTLLTLSDRQFYRECDIYGTVDFIFGNAIVVFQNCNIFVRKYPETTNTITAQGRIDAKQNTGFSFVNCVVTVAPDLKAVQSSMKAYLGRPWQKYSRTVFMKSYFDSLIVPAGWLEWNGDFALSTLYYGEYMNTGPGSSTTNRVKWGGYHVITNAAEASNFTVSNFIAGNSWLPSTGVPFTAGL